MIIEITVPNTDIFDEMNGAERRALTEVTTMKALVDIKRMHSVTQVKSLQLREDGYTSRTGPLVPLCCFDGQDYVVLNYSFEDIKRMWMTGSNVMRGVK